MAKKRPSYGSFKTELRKEIIRVFEANEKKPMNYKQVAGELDITDSGVRMLIHDILILEAEEGKLKEVETGKYIIANPSVYSAIGRIEINRFGKGYVSIEGQERDVEIPKGKTGFALYGDTVEVTFNPKSRRPEGKILRVVERSRREFVGILDVGKVGTFMLPSDKRVHVDFYISKEQLNGAEHGDKVLVQILDWDRPDSSPFGRVLRVFGKPGEHQAEMHAIIAEFGFESEFPRDVEDYANHIDAGITPKEIAKRRDFRKVPTFTIDPFDAKDFDDALSFQKLPNGNYEVGVHIADVSHYLHPNTILDAEAFDRATSVYLVDRTIPMLPERLSNFLCSLRPNEEKLCFSAVFELDDEAEIHSEWYGRTVIYSDRRFTYEEAQEIIEGKDGDFKEEILTLDKLAKKLRAERFSEGSIDFNSEEVKFKLDEKGVPTGVYVKQMKDSNQLIEDFMLLANRKVAAFIGDPSLPFNNTSKPKTFVYRIHDEPSPDKIEQLRKFVKQLGYKLPKTDEKGMTAAIKQLITTSMGKPEESVIKVMTIRSMAKAEYSTQNIGHYGLAFDFYTHFTSPIRRYPDVMVHRLLQHYLEKGKPVDESEYEMRCRHSSAMEKRAAEAERASIKYKQVEFMLARKGQVFEGIVSGLADWGIYVEEKESKCEGLIALNTIMDDHYSFDPDRYVVYGVRTKREFHMGDSVMVMVHDGDLQARSLDYILAEDAGLVKSGGNARESRSFGGSKGRSGGNFSGGKSRGSSKGRGNSRSSKKKHR
ncbi:MAG: ribonuclease R [Flavobacteriales bacterium]